MTSNDGRIFGRSKPMQHNQGTLIRNQLLFFLTKPYNMVHTYDYII